LIDYLEKLDIEPVGVLATTYSTKNQDGFNGAIVRFDFVLDYLSDEDGLY